MGLLLPGRREHAPPASAVTAPPDVLDTGTAPSGRHRLYRGLAGRMWSLGRRGSRRPAVEPDPTPAERTVSATLEIPAREHSRVDTHGLVRHTLAAWGLGDEQAAEDAHLLADTMLSSILDQTPEGDMVSITLTHRPFLLAIDMLGEPGGPARLPAAGRRRLASTRMLLDSLALRWAYHPDQPGPRIWCQLWTPWPAGRHYCFRQP